MIEFPYDPPRKVASYHVPLGTRLVIVPHPGGQDGFKIVQEVDGLVLAETAEFSCHSEPRDVIAVGMLFMSFLGLRADVHTILLPNPTVSARTV